MIKRIIALLCLLCLVASSGAWAQADLTLSSVKVDLWPEYDQPTVLVIYHITLPPQSVPVDISLRIPADAGSPHAVAARQADGQLLNLTYNQQVIGEWRQLLFTATTPEVQVEYYDPQLDIENGARHFEYTWPGDYPVDSMEVQVQQPVDASAMQISPSPGNGITGQDGLVYYTSEVGSLAAGQTFSITIDYQKSSDTLSAPSLQVQPSGPIDNSTSGRTATLTSALPWVLGALGLLLIVGGGLWYWQSGREKVRPARKSRHKSTSQREVAAPVEERISQREPAAPAEGHIYCHQCGKRAAPGDRFCRTCGTQLRTG